MAISRADLLKELTPALNKMFDEICADFDSELYITEVEFDGQDIQAGKL